ncbi:hypothetical protein [Candidatus Harpocratesius sp.]
MHGNGGIFTIDGHAKSFTWLVPGILIYAYSVHSSNSLEDRVFLK